MFLRDVLRLPLPPDDESEKHHRQYERFEREALALSEEFRAKAALILHEARHDIDLD